MFQRSDIIGATRHQRTAFWQVEMAKDDAETEPRGW
jgi:hypothetical protein